MIFLLWFVVLLMTLILYHRQAFSRFKKHGVKHFQPLPVVGNMLDLIMQRKHLTEQFDDLYYKFPNERFVGRYELTRPILVLRDLDLVKKITVKDYEHFLDHRTLVDEEVDPLFGRNLLSLSTQEWKDMRSTLSPAFTSSKIRLMVPFMLQVSDMMMMSLKDDIKKSGDDYIDVECRDLTTRYANDVIASCAFGLKVNSHMDVNNEFYTMGKDITNFGIRKVLLLLGHNAFPNLMKKLGLKFLSETTSNFYQNIILDTMKEREMKNIVRPDMIHLLMEAKKGNLAYDKKEAETDAGFATVEESNVGRKTINRDWSDDDLVAQAILFFIAGFDTVSTAMTFLLYELAINPEIQERLVQEIKEHDLNTSGKFDFNSIQKMAYLDMVVSEILRLWSPGVGLDRKCVKDYNMGKSNSNSSEDYIIRKGEGILIPTYSFHHNPEYFPEPLKFDPERFSEQNKHKIIPFTYAPFGYGPRNCIGSRFALCEIKVMTYQLLQQVEVYPCPRTQIPAKLWKGTFNLRLEGGHWLRFKERK